jgi:HEPN domain-containing protein
MLNRLPIPEHGGADVKLIDQYPLYELGSALRHLKDVAQRESATSVDQIFALFEGEHALNRLLAGEPVEIAFCRDATQSLLGHIASGISHFRDEQTRGVTAERPPLPNWRMGTLRSGIDVFEHQFSAELKRMAIYLVPRRGIFDTERLVANADLHIPESVRGILGEFAIKEYREAGRCLAFGVYSASGFHAMRAAEAVLQVYYRRFLGDPKKTDMTMGLMASHLRDRIEASDAALPKPLADTVRSIQDVVNFDRNPLVHKNLVLSEDDAMMLFNRAQGMISLMARELIARDEELQPPLPLLERNPFEASAAMAAGVPQRKVRRAQPIILKSQDEGEAS